jgi:predicted CXXCH cytochrome family protein
MTLPRLAVAAALAGCAAFAVAAGGGRLAPIADADATSRHAPYEMGQCDVCHEGGARGAPGKLRARGNELCFDCHDEFRKAVKDHPASAAASCVGCHSPHNARKKKLLL